MSFLSSYMIPSEVKELKSLVGLRITEIIKASFETYEEHLEYLDECSIEGYDDIFSFFKYSYGVFLIKFEDNSEFSFSLAEDLNSLIVCHERNTDNITNQKYLLEDTDVLDKKSISELNINSDIINQIIISIDILTRNDLSPKERGLPSELGLRFNLSNQRSFTISHNLNQNNFTFSILFDNESLSSNVITKLSYPQKLV